MKSPKDCTGTVIISKEDIEAGALENKLLKLAGKWGARFQTRLSKEFEKQNKQNVLSWRRDFKKVFGGQDGI